VSGGISQQEIGTADKKNKQKKNKQKTKNKNKQTNKKPVLTLTMFYRFLPRNQIGFVPEKTFSSLKNLGEL
jgi:hypothetical protein